MSKTILQSGKEVSYTYDKLGRLTSKNINSNAPINSSYTYKSSLRGTVDGKTYTTTYIDTEETPAFGYKYKYDALGNITDIYEGEKASNGSYTYDTDNMIHYRYTYDTSNQLTFARDPNEATVTSYTYDTNGNITSKTIRGWDLEENAALGIIESDTYTYGNSQWGDLLTAYNGQTITYDTIGNPLNYRDGITMTWQNGRQLATFTNDDEGIEATFTYDPSGMRTKKQIANLSTTEYVYEDDLLLKMKYGTYLFTFSYDANGSPIGFKLSRTNSTTADTYYYYGLNSRGDVVALYNASGTRIAAYSYDAYGKPLNTQILLAGHTTAININPLRYRGYVYDKETGLYYLQSRYYDPETCRFINPDVYYDTGVGLTGYNMFAYCNNNPIMYSDPTGTSCETHGCYYVPSCTVCNPDLADLHAERGADWAMHGVYKASNNKNNWQKVGDTVVAFVESVYIEAGVGFGVGVSIELEHIIKVEAMMKSDCLHVWLNKYDSDIGMDLNASIAVSVLEQPIWDIHEIYTYSSKDNQQYPCIDSPNTFDIISVSGYLIIGGSFTGGWNLDQFANEYNKIWY